MRGRPETDDERWKDVAVCPGAPCRSRRCGQLEAATGQGLLAPGRSICGVKMRRQPHGHQNSTRR